MIDDLVWIFSDVGLAIGYCLVIALNIFAVIWYWWLKYWMDYK